MTVTHYIKDNEMYCKTKSKTLNTTENIDDVTCKRCLNKVKSIKYKRPKIIVEKNRKNVTIYLKKNQFIFPLEGKIDMFMFTSPIGSIFTSCGLHGTQIKRCMTEKDRIYMVNTLAGIKQDGCLYSKDIYYHFNDLT